MSGVVYQSLTREEIAYLVVVHVWGDTVATVTDPINPMWYDTIDRRDGVKRGPSAATLADRVLSDYGLGRTISEMWRHGYTPAISLDAGRNNVNRFIFHNYTTTDEASFRITLGPGNQPRLARASAIAALRAIDPGAPP